MIKKLILITGILLSTSLWADMDKVCGIDASESKGMMTTEHFEFIRDTCVRNNIFQATNVDKGIMLFIYTAFCRMDRNIYYGTHSNIGGNGWDITCVLYDNSSRRWYD
tara:strand:- start:644 stop:967 length:324 start_codon:yes stop_codon:yes gene_type:complete